MIEESFDISFIADLALREKQIQQNYRPVIAVHKWFARRPGTLFRGLLLSEFSDAPLREAFFKSNQFPGVRVADPFMGGGTPLLEANRLGCDVVGFDINPMSYWIVKQEIEHIDTEVYLRSAYALRKKLEQKIGQFYRTRCVFCGEKRAHVKYFLWVKAISCCECGCDIDLFPGYLLAADSRHPKHVFVCQLCGQLTETDNRKEPGACGHCGSTLSAQGPAKRSRCECPNCGVANTYPHLENGPPRHRLFAIEYYCPSCKSEHAGRFFKSPDDDDLKTLKQAETKWAKTRPVYVPDDEIPAGDETNRLLRWGYSRYRDMFNARQLLGLELSAALIAGAPDERIRNALATNLSDLLRYQNMLCRYDTMALKSLDIFSVHGFPVGLIQCESNFLGILSEGKNTNVGSGGWANIIEKYHKAKSYCDAPFEIKHSGRKKEVIPIAGEWIGDRPNGKHTGKERIVDIQCRDAATEELPAASLDAVLTDPPYFGNVQYAELMDFCYVWLRRLLKSNDKAFSLESTRHANELTGNVNMGRGLEHFTAGLSAVFQRMARALKPGAPLAFTYHHNDIHAYYPVCIAILDAGLTCSASIPCPAEMGASIHISGTGSSIIDTVFVCRNTGAVSRDTLADSPKIVAALVEKDCEKLRAAGVEPTSGDQRCIAYGHLIRMAIWNNRKSWKIKKSVESKTAAIDAWIQDFGGWREVESHLLKSADYLDDLPLFAVRESKKRYGAAHAEVSF